MFFQYVLMFFNIILYEFSLYQIEISLNYKIYLFKYDIAVSFNDQKDIFWVILHIVLLIINMCEKVIEYKVIFYLLFIQN